MTISDTQRKSLNQAAQHPDGLAVPPAHLPPAPRAAIARALLNAGLVARADGLGNDTDWKLDGELVSLRITNAGRMAIGAGDQNAGTAVVTAPAPTEAPLPKRPHLREAATALIARWDATTDRNSLTAAIADLRAALALMGRSAGAVRGPRQGTKQAAVLALLRRPEGATIARVVGETAWAQHTVRGFLAGLKKKGHRVEVLERVRHVGPGNAGAKGSYSVYRITETA